MDLATIATETADTTRSLPRPSLRRRTEQLSLLDSAIGKRRTVLDERTRRIGLAGVAEARAKLAAQAARRAEREAMLDGAIPRRHAA